MAVKMEYKGRDIEEAIGNACASMNVGRDEIDIEVVATGSAGIFGLGRKSAVITVRLKKEKGEAGTAPAPSQKGRPPRPKREKKAVAEKAVPEKAREPRKELGREPEIEEEDNVVGDPVSPEEIEQIRQTLAGILDLMGCPSQVGMEQDDKNKVLAHIRGDYNDIVIGPEGQVLDGLQFLMRKIITKKFPQKVLFALDAGEFRANRSEELRERAIALAKEVKETGRTQSIPAINPAERRIVHMALQDDTEIRSRSVGDGLFKKVLIYLPGKGRKRPPKKRKGGAAARE
jgi:spoIIIJ-associated protein